MASARSPVHPLPGFHRRFRVTPGQGWVKAEVEDDFHHMVAVLHHEEGVITRVEPTMVRAPWTTCPGAEGVLVETFQGAELAEVASRGHKTRNCTHLYDLVLLAAAHAQEQAPLVFDILVTDPVDGRRRAEIRRDGNLLLAWTEESFRLVEPDDLAGLELGDLRSWLDTLEPDMREAARLLRWGNMIANGRLIPLEQQSDATQMPPNCYTFQPDRAVVAKRVGVIRDFSKGLEQPLE